MPRKILGIVGSYRRGGVVDTLVEETLAAARGGGADTSKLYLLDQHIEFCRNCRECTQEPGTAPGTCNHRDDMAGLLSRCAESDALVLGAPVNFYNVNALTRRFMERLVCLSYWPWGAQRGPVLRVGGSGRGAVLVTAAAMPAFLVPLATGAPRALRTIAKTLGARPVATVCAGLMGDREHPSVPERVLRRARAAGRRLAS